MSGSTITSSSNRWIQYQATFTTNNAAITPILYDVTINYNFTNPPPNPSGTVYLNLYMSMTATVAGPAEPTQSQQNFATPAQDSGNNETCER